MTCTEKKDRAKTAQSHLVVHAQAMASCTMSHNLSPIKESQFIFKILLKRAIQALYFSQCVWFQWFTPWVTFKMHWTWCNVLRSVLPGSILPSLCVEYPKIKSLYPWNLLSSVYIRNHFNSSETILCINTDGWPVWLSWMCTIALYLSIYPVWDTLVV